MKFYIIDVFAEEKYQGNQLAVFLPDRDISKEEMHQIAREINFSETTFILSGKQDNGGYHVRIFTPAVEVPFAGHPTIGTAYIIHKMIEKGQGDSAALNLGAGTIPVTINGEILTMEQNQPEFGITVDKEVVAKALSIDSDDFDDAYPIQWVSTGLPCFAIPLKTVAAVGRCKVDHPSFAEFMKNVYQCNMFVFAREGEGLRARCFMDDPGYLEDPATGSANGDLAGYVLKHHYFGQDKVTYTVRQGIEMGRPSTLYINAERHGDSYKIFVGGKVCFVSEGEWK